METIIKPMTETFNENKTASNKGGIFIIIIFFGVFLGVISGFGLSNFNVNANRTTGEKIQTAKEVGVNDSKTFKDSAEGKLEKGGVDGEGTHHLVRPGGTSQNVYLTSSVIDLDQFVGKNVKVYGQTFAAKAAGWFMDVGKIEIK